MPDLTLYRDDVDLLIDGLVIAMSRTEKQGNMEKTMMFDKLGDLLLERVRQGLHPERSTQGESG